MALLSFSTKGSGKHAEVDKVVEALHIVQGARAGAERGWRIAGGRGGFRGGGPAPRRRDRRWPDAPTRWCFPNLAAANIGYKLVERLGGAMAIGPFLQGLAKPANDLSRGCSAEDIFNVAVVTALQSETGMSRHASVPAGLLRTVRPAPGRPRLPLQEIQLAARPPAAHPLRRAGRLRRARSRPPTTTSCWCTTPSGWRKLRNGTLSYQDILRLEIPYSRQMVEAFWLAAGGTMLAARQALEDGVGFNVGGGFHHAFPDHGEGFCAINDIAVAIRRLQRDGAIQRAMVVDCDVHHGNGTAAIFAGDPSVFTLSIHQFNNYPTEKPPSSLDIHLADGIGDAEYLHRLGNGYRAALAMFQPGLVLYVAGADPYMEDQLGGLSLTFEGLMERDRLVIRTALTQGIPVAIVLAGGYAQSVEDTVTIHANTAEVARDVLVKVGWPVGAASD